MASRSLPLVPRLGPAPRGSGVVAAFLLLTAIVLLAPASLDPLHYYVGNPTYPDAAATAWNHWMVHTLGLTGTAHTRMQMYPLVVDVLVLNGFPLDALASWPFAALLGWPGGYGLYQIAVMWAVGLSAAWLGGRWWRSSTAACVAGVAMQSAAPILREFAYGRSTQVFGSIFVPLALGLFARALVEGRRSDAIGAGVMTGLCALAYWYYGFFCGLGVLLLLGLAARERLDWVRPTGVYAAASAVVVFLPALYTMGSLGEQQGGMDTTLFSLIHFGEVDMRLIDLLEERDAGGAMIEGVIGLTPLVVAFALLGALGHPARRWAAPLIWTVVGGLLAMGPILVWMGDAPLPGPFALVPSLPVLRRLWWPDRALLLVVPAVALLAAGGVDRIVQALHSPSPRLPAILTGLLSTALIAEAWLALPTVPLPVTSSVPSAGAEALAAGTGPVLVLPQAGGPYLLNRTLLLDQMFHGRPLVNGLMPPDGTTAPQAYRNFSAGTGMAHLYSCATTFGTFTGDAAAAVLPLRRAGIREVYVDLAVLSGSAAGSGAYVNCVRSLLGAPSAARGPYQVWTLAPAAD